MKTRKATVQSITFLLVLLITLIQPAAVLSKNMSEAVQPPHMVKDINTCTVGSSIRFMAHDPAGELYFSAIRAGHGLELWRTDGSTTGTQLVHAISPNTDNRIFKAVWLNNNLYWLLSDSAGDLSLWKSDGTPAGAELIKEIYAGENYALPSSFVVMNNQMFFIISVYTSMYEYTSELWRSNGLAEGTIRVASFTQLQGNWETLTVFDHALYFGVKDPIAGVELWHSDGTAAGTGLFADLNPLGNASPFNLLAVDNRLYFTAYDSNNRRLLWVSDGTPANTKPIMVDGYYPTAPLVALNGIAYFPAFQNGSSALHLWRSDGSAAGTWQVSEVSFGSEELKEQTMGVFQERLVFAANRFELWESDGTSAGTRRIKDMSETPTYGFTPVSFYDVGGLLYFVALNWGGSPTLWRSDGSEAGTVWVENDTVSGAMTYINQYPTKMGTNQLLLTSNADCMGDELMRVSEPVLTPKAELVKDIETKTASAEISAAAYYQGQVYFPAVGGGKSSQLWASDGSQAGTRVVKAMPSGAGFINQDFPHAIAGGILFFAASDEHGNELWRTDGTTEGTLMVRDITPSRDSSYISGLVAYQDRLFFVIRSTLSGPPSLWTSDGTETGTQLVKALPAGPDRASTPLLCNGLMYFLARDTQGNFQLYRSDGSQPGTALVHAWAASVPYLWNDLACAGNKVYFFGHDTAHGVELWESDGTLGGTHLTADLTPGVTSSTPWSLQAAGGRFLYTMVMNGSAWSLWRVPGQQTSAEQLFQSDLALFKPYTLKTSGTYGYFSVYNIVQGGTTIWRTDGTPSGTYTLTPEIGQYSLSNEFLPLGAQVFFGAYTPETGSELWISDGTPAGTHLAFDLLPGPGSSYPSSLLFSQGELWFAAEDDHHGREMWVYDYLPLHNFLPVIDASSR